jgi:foldase protein PrsA
MLISRKLAAGAAFFVLAGAVAGCGSSVPSSAVAEMAGNPITLSAYKHWMYVAATDVVSQEAAQGVSAPVIVSSDPNNYSSCIKNLHTGVASLHSASRSTLLGYCKEVFTSDTSQVLQFLLEGYWYQAQAHKLGLKAPKLLKDFDAYIKKQWPTKKDFASYLKSSGQTRQDLLFQYTVETYYLKLLKAAEKPVTKKQIAAYYAAHKSSYGTPESRDVHLLRTKSAAQAQAAVNALKAGQSWTVVARRYSADAAGKANGGLLDGVTSGEYEVAANNAIFNNPVGKLVGPVKGVLGYYVTQVTKIVPAVQQPLATVSAAIKSTLENAQQTAAATTVANAAKKAWFKQTTCRSPYESQLVCSNYKAPPTTTVPSTTSSTPTSSTPTKSTTTATKSTTTKTSTKKSKKS